MTAAKPRFATGGRRLQSAVARALRRTPEVEAARIRVGGYGAVITLAGIVGSLPAKLAAECAAQREHGVRVVISTLDVIPQCPRDDRDLAADVHGALASHADVPSGVQAAVANGAVTLTGSVEWGYQKTAAEYAVLYLRGVRAISNLVTIRPHMVCGVTAATDSIAVIP